MPANYSIAILNSIRDNASYEYQERIPLATQENIVQIGNALQTYTPLYNEFAEALINKIGRTILESKMMNNRLARFKQGEILSEQDVEEIFIDMARSEGAYDPQGSNPLGRRELPNVYAIYHRMNRQDVYCVSIGEVDFVRVFRSPATLDSFIGRLINSLYSGDSYDEWQLMKNLLATYGVETMAYRLTSDTSIIQGKNYYTQSGSFPNIVYTLVANPVAASLSTYYEQFTIPENTGYAIYNCTAMEDATTKQAFAREFVKTVRKAVQDMSFPSTEYNAAGVMTYSDPSEMVLLVNKDVLVEVDVEQLATAFHSSETDLKVVPTIIAMDDFGIMENTYAIICDKDFFRVWDTLLRTEPQRNAQGLFTNYFFHHWQIMSLSNFKNAALIKEENA